MDRNTKIIELRNVSKSFDGETVLKNLFLDIHDKEFITLLGPSGCGKTTTLRIIGGFVEPDEGDVCFMGARINDLPPYKRNVNTVFQRYALFPHLNVFENIAFGLRVHRTPEREIVERVEKMIALVNLKGFEKRNVTTLSGGQQQRVAIARTLAPEPTVLFMDEPLSNLDAKLRLEMRSELQRLHLDTGSTFVYVTHDQMEAMTLATKICLIDNGVLQQYDAPLTVYGKPANTFVADFVGNPQINFIEAEGGQAGEGIEVSILENAAHATFRSVGLDLAEWQKNDKAIDRAKEELRIERARDKKNVEKGNKDVKFRCRIAKVVETEIEDEKPATERDFIIGVRPEAIKISDGGRLEGEIYSAMPTGMETTVRIRVGNLLLTGVIFGGITYGIGQTVRFDITGDDIMLFSAESGRLIATGSLDVR